MLIVTNISDLRLQLSLFIQNQLRPAYLFGLNELVGLTKAENLLDLLMKRAPEPTYMLSCNVILEYGIQYTCSHFTDQKHKDTVTTG